MAAGLGIRIYLDEMMDVQLAAALCRLGYDATDTHSKGNDHLFDDEQLRYAASQGRAILTVNFGDFARHHADFLQRRESHEGIILVPERPLRELLKRLRKHLDTVAPDQQRNNMLWA